MREGLPRKWQGRLLGRGVWRRAREELSCTQDRLFLYYGAMLGKIPLWPQMLPPCFSVLLLWLAFLHGLKFPKTEEYEINEANKWAKEKPPLQTPKLGGFFSFNFLVLCPI